MLQKVFALSRRLPTLLQQHQGLAVASRGFADGPFDSDKDGIVSMPNPFERPKKMCILCRMNITPDYKNARLLSQFQSRFTGKIYGRHITGLCENKQRQLERAAKMSQEAGLMPTYLKDLRFVDDPKLYNPDRPLRPHPY